jgi:hypothetical protein
MRGAMQDYDYIPVGVVENHYDDNYFQTDRFRNKEFFPRPK